MQDTQKNFNPVFDGVELGIGTWSWGDRLYWGFGSTYAENEVSDAFKASVQNGVTFFDTAEVYGQGKSEVLLGKLLKETGADIKVASKIMPFPWRITHRGFKNALKASLERLERAYIDLYQLHMPLPPIKIETWMEYLAEAYQNKQIRAVGVSNFNVEQMQRAYDALIKLGVTLASNQVEYSLLDREIEKNGVLRACQEMGVKCIAYSPIGMGLLSGKYSDANPLKGMRASKYSHQDLIRIKPLVETLKKVGADHGGKSASQVAINWVRAKGALPIPGAKNHDQAVQNSSVLSWNLSEIEISRLDDISKHIAKEK
jgi:aryl-alcohol dehydrogenase-like predicted oxidoreductase